MAALFGRNLPSLPPATVVVALVIPPKTAQPLLVDVGSAPLIHTPSLFVPSVTSTPIHLILPLFIATFLNAWSLPSLDKLTFTSTARSPPFGPLSQQPSHTLNHPPGPKLGLKLSTALLLLAN